MELILDNLSIWLLSFILVLTLVHLVLLRKPEPATHPLLLGRQSELNKVRKPNESPAFISATAGLGGQAKQLFRNAKTVQSLWQGRDSRIALGNMARESSLEGKVAAMQDALKADTSGRPFTVRIEDAADAFVATLAAAEHQAGPPILLASSSSIAEKAVSPLMTSTQEMQLLRGSKAAAAGGSMYLVDSGIALKTNPDKWTPEGWTTQRIVVEDLAVKPIENSTMKEQDPNSAFATFISNVHSAEHTFSISHRNIVDGGVVSILSLFPHDQRPKEGDRILSFENVLSAYGQAVAVAGAAVGATLRLCSPSKGITSKCRTFSPDMIFCTPNELNAFRASLKNVLPKESLVVPLSFARKRSLLRSGNVSKTTFWDKVVFSKVRANVVGDRLRCIVCSAEEGAGPSNEVIEYLRLAVGVPIIVALTHPLVAGPISNTMYSDFQIFPNSGELSQVGAPSATMECKLVNANEEAIKDGTYRGDLVVKGPSVASSFESNAAAIKTKDGWIKTGITAELQTNGTLRCIKAL